MKSFFVAAAVATTVVSSTSQWGSMAAEASPTNNNTAYAQQQQQPLVLAPSSQPHRTLEHKCIHDSPSFQEMLKKDHKVLSQSYAVREHGFGGQAAATSRIRIVTSSLDLDDSTKYCTSSSGTVSDFSGSTISCTPDPQMTSDTNANVFTPAKKSILLDKVLPQALSLIESVLLVDPVVGNLNVGNGCSRYTVPQSHKDNGVPNADYALYISVAPTSGSTVAWAGSCAQDPTGRPISGRANFSPMYLVWDEADIGAQRQLVRTAVHEIMHALGFSGGFWGSSKYDYLRTETRRGLSRTVMTAPLVASAAQSYFGCETLTGPEIEDEGGSGTGGSHWERRTHLDDVMSGIVGERMYISHVTLAMFESLGFYGIDYSNAETPEWVKNAGCGIHDNKCNTAAGGWGSWFCNPDANENACAFDYRSIGTCAMSTYTADLPVEEQYFAGSPRRGGAAQLMNYCPIVIGYSNRRCEYDTATTNDTAFGNYFGSDSKCFQTTANVLSTAYNPTTSDKARCLRTRCVVDQSQQRVEFQIGNSAWIRCSGKGAVIQLSTYGFYGSVTCPDVATHCPPSASDATTAPVSSTTAATTTAGSTTTGGPTTSGATPSATTTEVPVTTTVLSTTPAPTIPPMTGLPSTPNPTQVRLSNPIVAFISFTIVGEDVLALLSAGAVAAFRAAVAADIASVSVIDQSGAETVVDRHMPTVHTIAGRQLPAIDMRVLITMPQTPPELLMTMWLLALNTTLPTQPALWMTRTQNVFNGIFNTSNEGVVVTTTTADPTNDGSSSSSGGDGGNISPILAEQQQHAAGGFRPAAADGEAVTPFAVVGLDITPPAKDDGGSFLASCGDLGCVATAAVATIGGWAAVVLIVLIVYQVCCVKKSCCASDDGEDDDVRVIAVQPSKKAVAVNKNRNQPFAAASHRGSPAVSRTVSNSNNRSYPSHHHQNASRQQQQQQQAVYPPYNASAAQYEYSSTTHPEYVNNSNDHQYYGRNGGQPSSQGS